MIKVGDKFPANYTLKKVTGENVEDFSTSNLETGKIVIFGLPGAFTPTCSNAHLPSYLEAFQKFKEQGVSEILCLSVNDHFVLKAWGKHHNVGDKISFLADFDGALTEALGLTLDATGAGLGKRSHRYGMLLENGIVQKFNLEEAVSACTISRGDAIL